MERGKVILVICDGLGYREEQKYNAIAAADMPNFKGYMADYPTALLKAAGEDVGLPEGQMGTSEANHLVIGSGRIVYQNLAKINRSIKTGDFFSNIALMNAISNAKQKDSAFHILGILGDGGVHGHDSHLKALVEAAKKRGLTKVYLHFFTDGRDTAPQSAIPFIEAWKAYLAETGVGQIASIGGRYFGMDRDNNLERTSRHFDVIVKGEGPRFTDPVLAIEAAYKQGTNDEFIEPCLIDDESGAAHYVEAGDSVIFANFRSDRAKQLTKMIIDEQVPGLHLTVMTKYYDELEVPVMFGAETVDNTLSEEISRNGLKQLKITETEKFTHLTFFFNAQKYEPEAGEERVLIPSNKDVATHDLKPEMKAAEIAKGIVEAVNARSFDFIATNLVNCDMVGHTGNFPAIIKGVEAVDKALGEIVTAAKANGYDVIITADHGNAEEKFDEKTGQVITSHSLNPVPFILISDRVKSISHKEGLLSDIAPTILDLLALPKPKEMTGESFV